uniref:GRF1-interacting factor 2-like isoform X2 n=1 Tax=Erigeron canadensis TaxID=72917 RepID=UPI001CB8B32E|nr:GRF1-interacting factor 2-like isoform X2 [Erigeron canadensis]
MKQQSQSQTMMPNQMLMTPSAFPPSNITTDQIQKFLDENKQLILAIMNNQNVGKLAECAQYQALLQKNLMYLAAIADAQPPTPTGGPAISSQMSPLQHPGIAQQGGFFMQQHPQAAVMAQQPSGFPQQMPAMQFNNSPQVIQPQMGVRSGVPSGVPPSSAASDIWRGSMPDSGAADGAGKDSHGGATGGSEEGK